MVVCNSCTHPWPASEGREGFLPSKHGATAAHGARRAWFMRDHQFPFEPPDTSLTLVLYFGDVHRLSSVAERNVVSGALRQTCVALLGSLWFFRGSKCIYHKAHDGRDRLPVEIVGLYGQCGDRKAFNRKAEACSPEAMALIPPNLFQR